MNGKVSHHPNSLRRGRDFAGPGVTNGLGSLQKKGYRGLEWGY